MSTVAKPEPGFTPVADADKEEFLPKTGVVAELATIQEDRRTEKENDYLAVVVRIHRGATIDADVLVAIERADKTATDLQQDLKVCAECVALGEQIATEPDLLKRQAKEEKAFRAAEKVHEKAKTAVKTTMEKVAAASGAYGETGMRLGRVNAAKNRLEHNARLKLFAALLEPTDTTAADEQPSITPKK